MTFRVTILARARADVDHIYEWINQRSNAGAIRWYAALVKSVELLADSPESCGLAPESASLTRAVRERFFRTRRGRVYRILFTIDGEDVRVLRIRGPGQ